MGSRVVKQAGLDVRVSQFDVDVADPDRRRSLGTQRQEAAVCRSEASKRGWEVHDHYCDDDRRSPASVDPPTRRCEEIKNHVIDAVIVWDVDRLHRNPRELEDFVTLIESTGATVVSVVRRRLRLGERRRGVLDVESERWATDVQYPRMTGARASRWSRSSAPSGGVRRLVAARW